MANPNDKSEYGKKIRDERIAQQLTQNELAEMVNKDQSYISSIESGNVNVSVEIFMEIMAAMGIIVTITADGEEIKSNSHLI